MIRLAFMKIIKINLYTIGSGENGARGATEGESQYWGGGWAANSLIANPMSIYPKYSQVRTLWMGPGQDPYAIEIETDEGKDLQPIFDTIIGEPLPQDGHIHLDENKPGFGVELNRDKLIPWKE